MMPHQPWAYSIPQPLEPCSLEEVKFWLRIMREHAVFIRAGLPCKEDGLIAESREFERAFAGLQEQCGRIKNKNKKKIHALVTEASAAVREFYRYKRDLLKGMMSRTLCGTNYPLFLDHTAREAEYFLCMLEKMKSGCGACKEASLTQENVFWLRGMADHAKFIAHLLDPSERKFVETAREFSCMFDQLTLQGRDFASMLHCRAETAQAFGRFIQDVRVDVQRLRDFKKGACDLIAQCRLLGIMPEQMADHIRREADHFLLLLSMMENGLIKNIPPAGLEDAPCMDDECAGYTPPVFPEDYVLPEDGCCDCAPIKDDPPPFVLGKREEAAESDEAAARGALESAAPVILVAPEDEAPKADAAAASLSDPETPLFDPEASLSDSETPPSGPETPPEPPPAPAPRRPPPSSGKYGGKPPRALGKIIR